MPHGLVNCSICESFQTVGNDCIKGNCLQHKVGLAKALWTVCDQFKSEREIRFEIESGFHSIGYDKGYQFSPGADIVPMFNFEGTQEVLDGLAKNKFVPLEDDHYKLPDHSGVYLICSSSIDILPNALRELEYNYFNGLPVIYIGIAGRPTSRVRSLRKRDYKNHFCGNARGSTLRKSLGVLFEFRKVFSEKSVRSTKYKFQAEDEGTLSEWMKTNLTLHFLQMEEPLLAEQFLINYFNPPLNIKDNHNKTNLDFRKKLSELRRIRS